MRTVKSILALWAAYTIGHRVGWGKTHGDTWFDARSGS